MPEPTLYDLVSVMHTENRDRLGRIEATQSRIEGKLDDVKAAQAALDTRVTVVEGTRNTMRWFMSAMTVAILGLISQALYFLVTGRIK